MMRLVADIQAKLTAQAKFDNGDTAFVPAAGRSDLSAVLAPQECGPPATLLLPLPLFPSARAHPPPVPPFHPPLSRASGSGRQPKDSLYIPHGGGMYVDDTPEMERAVSEHESSVEGSVASSRDSTGFTKRKLHRVPLFSSIL